MSDQTPEVKNVNTTSSKPFSQMNGGERLKFVGKLIVALLTFGFVYPTILND